MFLHKEGKVAEYAHSKDKFYYDIVDRPSGLIWFDNVIFDDKSQVMPGWFSDKIEALQAAMDYHETEGCKLYLELYPAPEKGLWSFIAQDMSGDWYGYEFEPKLIQNDGGAMWTKGFVPSKSSFISQSPPNPFWRKTLQ